MRIVLQRVNSCTLIIEQKEHSAIKKGLLVLVGIEETDTLEDVLYLSQKLVHLRIFSDSDGKMNLDVKQVNGEVMVVSQFTLHALTKKGNRPSFIKAARPEQAIVLYMSFLSELSALLGKDVSSGVFGANMQISLVNDGPVTIVMDSKMKE